MTATSLPPPFIQHRNGHCTTFQCSTCGFMWAFKAGQIDRGEHGGVLDDHQAEHAAVAVGRRK